MKSLKLTIATLLLAVFSSLGSFAEVINTDKDSVLISLNFASEKEFDEFNFIQLENYLLTLEKTVCTVSASISIGVVTAASVTGPCSEVGAALQDLLDRLKGMGFGVSKEDKSNLKIPTSGSK